MKTVEFYQSGYQCWLRFKDQPEIIWRNKKGHPSENMTMATPQQKGTVTGAITQWQDLGEFETLAEANNVLLADHLAEHQERKAKKEAEKARLESIAKNLETATAKEVYDVLNYSARKGDGWQAADILLQHNALSKLLEEKIGGGYTVTPFDNGQILVKTKNNKRYGLLRGPAAVAKQNGTIYELLH